MDRLNTLRRSALAFVAIPEAEKLQSNSPFTLFEAPRHTLHQIAVWPDRFVKVRDRLAAEFLSARSNGPWMSLVSGTEAILHVEPLKFWHLGGKGVVLDPNDGVMLDISHSRTHLCVGGQYAREVLNKHLPLDLRVGTFPVGAVASTAMHGVGVTIWHREEGYELFLPRSFARALYELLK